MKRAAISRFAYRQSERPVSGCAFSPWNDHDGRSSARPLSGLSGPIAERQLWSVPTRTAAIATCWVIVLTDGAIRGTGDSSLRYVDSAAGGPLLGRPFVTLRVRPRDVRARSGP